MKAGTQKAAAPGNGAKYVAAAVVGMLAGAGAVYSWMRSPTPAVIEAPRGEVTEVRRTSPERPSKPIEKRYAETPAPPQPVAELAPQVEPAAEPEQTPAPEPAAHLDSVKGVGTKTLAKLAPMVTVGDELP